MGSPQHGAANSTVFCRVDPSGSIRRRVQLLVPIIVSLAVIAPGVVRADEKDVAREKFKEGVALVERADYINALTRFEESYRLYPNGTSLINIAMCLKELDRYVKSITAFERFLDEYGPTADPDRKEKAAAAIAEMEKLIGSLHITGAPDGAEIVVDGRSRGQMPLEEPLALDPGEHMVELKRDGYDSLNTSVSIASGEQTAVEAALVPIEPMNRSMVEPAAPPPDRPASPGVRPPDAKRVWLLGTGIAATGLGAIAGAIGIGFTVKGYRDYTAGNDLLEQADEAWAGGDLVLNAEIEQRYDEYRTERMPRNRAWMIAGYASAAALIGTGVVLMILGTTEEPAGTLSASPTPGGLVVRF